MGETNKQEHWMSDLNQSRTSSTFCKKCLKKRIGKNEQRKVKRNSGSPKSEQNCCRLFIMAKAEGNLYARGEVKSFSTSIWTWCVFVCLTERMLWQSEYRVAWHSGQREHQSWRTHLVSKGCLCLNMLFNHSQDAALWFFHFLLIPSFNHFPCGPITFSFTSNTIFFF